MPDMTSRYGAHAALRWVAFSVCALAGCSGDKVDNPFDETQGASTGAASSSSDGAGMVTSPGSSSDGGSSSGAMGTTMAADDTAAGDTTMAVADTGDGSSGSGSGDEGSSGGGESSSSDGGGESSSSGDDGGMTSVPCPVDTIDMWPFSISDSTVGQESEFGSACGGGGAPEMSFEVTAPIDGFYVFDTFGSSHDTVLYVLDGACGGPVLACNDDDDQQAPASQVSVALTEGQTVTVVADGFGLSGGNFTLTGTVFAGTCPNGDLGNTVPQTFMGSTATVDNTFFGTCGGNSANDDALTFTAPAAGLYQIDTEGSSFDTVLYVLNGDCSGSQIGCSDDSSGGTHSRVNVNLAAGQQIVIIVDGTGVASGDYVVNIAEATDSGNCCVSHAGTGCEDPMIQSCVCAFDSYCCNFSWDTTCANEAVDFCEAICV